MTVTSKRKAWQAADALMPTDYEKDEARTAGAGYPIYYSTADGVNARWNQSRPRKYYIVPGIGALNTSRQKRNARRSWAA